MNFLQRLFPSVCILCRQRAGRAVDLCLACERALATNEAACRRCAEPLTVPPSTAPPLTALSTERLCGACLAKPPPWSMKVAPFLYSPPLTTIVEGLKSGNGLKQARILGDVLAPRLRTRYQAEPLPQAIVPMPLTRKRRRQRGYNQADLLATAVGRALGLPRHRGHLVRKRDAPPQRTLARSARLRNVRGAFAMRRPLPCRRVALLDDVSTTGATVRAATEALLAGGVAEVHVWVVAKTP